MGYTTDFQGEFSIRPSLKEAHRLYLVKFSETRRMKRDSEKTIHRKDPIREAVGLPVGVEGEYFVGETGFAGQDRGVDIIDYNNPSKTQSGLWCQWVPSECGRVLKWNEAEKFYYYVEWLEYLIKHFFIPWEYAISGQVEWEGEDHRDVGRIIVCDNQITVKKALLVWD